MKERIDNNVTRKNNQITSVIAFVCFLVLFFPFSIFFICLLLFVDFIKCVLMQLNKTT